MDEYEPVYFEDDKQWSGLTTEDERSLIMAESKNKDNRVEVFVPKGYATEEPNFFVGINGKSYLLPRGKRSLVPPEVAMEINRAERAQQARDARSAALADGAEGR